MASNLIEFTDELLVPIDGEIVHTERSSGHVDAGTWGIKIPLAPFSSDDQVSTNWRVGTEGPHIVSTAIVLEYIRLPVDNFEGLSGQTFHFPVNPDGDYVDGSVYLGTAHNPVDVTEIQFGQANGDSISARFVAEFIFDQELDAVSNRSATFSTTLQFHEPPFR